MTDDAVRFSMLAPDVLKFGIRKGGAVALKSNPKTFRHELGLPGSPRFLLQQPYAPDEAWTFNGLPQGTPVPVPETPARDALVTWSGDATLARQIEALRCLPTGDYLVLKTKRLSFRPAHVLFGNERQPTPENVRVIREEEPFYAFVFGDDAMAPPPVHTVLIGVVVLNYVGASWMNGIIFLPIFDHNTPSSLHDHGETILVLPQSGNLLLDNLHTFSSSVAWEADDRNRWRDRLVWDFTEWLTGYHHTPSDQ